MKKALLTILCIGFMAFAGLAYAQDVSNPLSIQGHGKTEIDFNINNGKIFHDGQLHVQAGSGGDMYLNASHRIHITNGDVYFMRNYDSWAGSQSRIYDNNDFHFATDDYLFLDAPKLVTIQKDLKVNGDIYTSSGVLSATQLDDNTSSIQELTDEKLSLSGGTMEGTIDMNGNEINNAVINSNLVVKGSLYNSAGSVVINDSINQTGNGQVNLTGKLYVDDNLELTGDLSATGALYTTSGALDTTGGTVLHVGEFYANSITLHKPTTVSSNFTVTGGVDFSGASSQKLPVASTGGSCAADADRGKIYYDTDDNHIYVCQKSGITFGWVQLDNSIIPN